MASTSSPVVIITEQPAGFYRYRYESEGKSKIPGTHSKPNNETYPSIQILGYEGEARIIISCVSKDKPHKRHPHNIVGNNENYKQGIYVDYVTVGATNTFTFNGIGIQCNTVKKNRQSKMDLTVVRLKFEVYLRGPTKYDIRLDPVYSKPIYNATGYPSLIICKLSHCSSSTAGGERIKLFCKKVNKEDISVRFYEEINGMVVWEEYGIFQPNDVHRREISVTTPKYNSNSVCDVNCFIQLKRPSDGVTSLPVPFTFTQKKRNAGEAAFYFGSISVETPSIVQNEYLSQSQEEFVNSIFTNLDNSHLESQDIYFARKYSQVDNNWLDY